MSLHCHDEKLMADLGTTLTPFIERKTGVSIMNVLASFMGAAARMAVDGAESYSRMKP
jgi:hypothetical protein